MIDEYINKKDVVNLGVMMQTHLWTREQTYNAIFCLPSADVAPVRHGHWRLVSRLDEVEWLYGVVIECSQCKHEEVKHYNYCPNCGAKMDEGEER